jgi:hypothetical protein
MGILPTKILFLLILSLAYGNRARWEPTQCGAGNLITKWGKQVDPSKVLPEYPRPQMVRGDTTWKNLNGLWQFEPAKPTDSPPFGKPLNGTILVPFPVESCLSGVGTNYIYLWYRLEFQIPANFVQPTTLIHFGAVDWQTRIYVNRINVGNHTGGYDGFSFDITKFVTPSSVNELIVYVYDPSDLGYQPNGKQRISAINQPGSDTYSPSSGIWQTVWLENVPSQYISDVTILADTRTLTVSANVSPPSNTSSNLNPVIGI